QGILDRLEAQVEEQRSRLMASPLIRGETPEEREAEFLDILRRTQRDLWEEYTAARENVERIREALKAVPNTEPKAVPNTEPWVETIVDAIIKAHPQLEKHRDVLSEIATTLTDIGREKGAPLTMRE